MEADMLPEDRGETIALMDPLLLGEGSRHRVALTDLPPKSGTILQAILYRGELPRGEVDTVVGTGERQARRIVSALVDRGVLESNIPRSPLRMTFPAALGHRWMPGLFPEQVA